jgi:hypothetical protein
MLEGINSGALEEENPSKTTNFPGAAKHSNSGLFLG